MNDLTTRVLNAIPAGAFEMNALLSLLRIEETDTVATASVSCEHRPVLRINPEFVRQHCRTDEHLFLLVMHELHHVLLGHTRLFPRATRAHNIAFDAVINAMLVHRFPAAACTSFFLDLYGAEEGALRLLAPPEGDAISAPALCRLHQVLYFDDHATAEEIFNAVTEAVATEGTVVVDGDGVLLGDHFGGDDADWGTGGLVDPDFVQAIRDIVERWPLPESPIRGRSLAEIQQRADVGPVRPAEQVLRVIRRALRGAAQNRSTATLIAPRQIRVQDVVPNPSDRRAMVVRTTGVEPLLYWRTSEALRRGRAGRARVYLDVSGSMVRYLPLLYGALVALRDDVEPDIWLFSTTVTAIPMTALKRGHVQTTIGTDIECVIKDVLQHRVRKALIVTDGYVGAPTRAQSDALKRARAELRVVLTPEGWRKDLQRVAVRVDELPSLSGGTSTDSGEMAIRGGRHRVEGISGVRRREAGASDASRASEV